MGSCSWGIRSQQLPRNDAREQTQARLGDGQSDIPFHRQAPGENQEHNPNSIFISKIILRLLSFQTLEIDINGSTIQIYRNEGERVLRRRMTFYVEKTYIGVVIRRVCYKEGQQSR